MLMKTTGVKANENITRKAGKFTKGRVEKKKIFQWKYRQLNYKDYDECY